MEFAFKSGEMDLKKIWIRRVGQSGMPHSLGLESRTDYSAIYSQNARDFSLDKLTYSEACSVAKWKKRRLQPAKEKTSVNAGFTEVSEVVRGGFEPPTHGFSVQGFHALFTKKQPLGS